MRNKFIAVLIAVTLGSSMTAYAAGPGEQIASYNQSSAATMGAWEDLGDGTWKYKMADGSYLINAWIESQTEAGVWFFVGADGVMMKGGNTPDGYYVNVEGEYREGQREEQSQQDSPQQDTSGGVSSPGRRNTNGNLKPGDNTGSWLRG